jgi:hypothetical protein
LLLLLLLLLLLRGRRPAPPSRRPHALRPLSRDALIIVVLVSGGCAADTRVLVSEAPQLGRPVLYKLEEVGQIIPACGHRVHIANAAGAP